MKITFLIGNGFDINVGLKTSYLDFYSHIKIICNEGTSNEIYKAIISDFFNSEKNIVEIDWSDFEIGVGKYTEKIQSESELEKFYLDFEEFVDEFTTFIEAQLKEVNLSEFTSDSVEVFNAAIQKPINLEERDQEKLRDNYKKFSAQQRETNFIVFNYTKIFDDAYYEWKEKYKNNSINSYPPVHIHGFCRDQILMGVNDETQVCERFSKEEDLQMMMVKTISNKNALTLRFENANDIIAKSNLIVLFGMSLGDSDKYWWQKIVENLKAASSNNVLIYAYEPEKDHLHTHNRQLIKRKKEWQNKLLKHASNEDKEKLSKQIFIQFKTTKIFNFKSLQSFKIQKSLENVES